MNSTVQNTESFFLGLDEDLSDGTKISGALWSELKEEAMKPDYLTKPTWFVSATINLSCLF